MCLNLYKVCKRAGGLKFEANHWTSKWSGVHHLNPELWQTFPPWGMVDSEPTGGCRDGVEEFIWTQAVAAVAAWRQSFHWRRMAAGRAEHWSLQYAAMIKRVRWTYAAKRGVCECSGGLNLTVWASEQASLCIYLYELLCCFNLSYCKAICTFVFQNCYTNKVLY